MKIKYRELRFLCYFLPLFFLKLINTPPNRTLVLTALVCFTVFIFQELYEKYTPKVCFFFMTLSVYATLLILTCGKEGVFFSVVMIIAMKDISLNQRVYKCCLWIGFAAVLLSMYLERNGVTVVRYMNGSWSTIYKRSNILYISFMAIICLYVLKKEKLSWPEMGIIITLGYSMYKYSGSRTGLVCIILLVVILVLLKFKCVQRLKLIKWGCILTPALCMFFSYFTSFYYGTLKVLDILNFLLEGRLAQGKNFLNNYEFKLLGQKIFESYDPENFSNLDCAYLDMLICYGVIFAALWICVSCLIIKWLYERGRYACVAVMMMYAVYGIAETFLPNCFLNPSLFLYAEYLYNKLSKQQRLKQITKNIY